MSDMRTYVVSFFDSLDMMADAEGHAYKAFLSSAVYEFLQNETKDKAYNLYTIFFDIYRIKTEDGKSFIDLLDVLKRYEEGAVFTDIKQRDHYIHSVNVFILGLCIYSQNESFRNVFAAKNKEFLQFDSVREEFLFRWGIASLFHDIGYPVEIVNNQLTSFIALVADKQEMRNLAKPYISFFNFEKVNCIKSLNIEKIKLADFLEENPESDRIDPLKPTDLLSYSLHRSFDLPLGSIRLVLDNFLSTMQESGFVDHGFYSSLIVLKWYGEMLQGNCFTSNCLFSQILDSASAIFLHNAYRNILRKEPFSLGSLAPGLHPLAYMLILCDEAQEWNRKTDLDISCVGADHSRVFISEDSLKFHYITKQGVLCENFLAEKKELFYHLLDIKALFRNGLDITATTLTEKLLDRIKEEGDQLIPRPLLEKMERLAKAIHEKYNESQKKRNPDQPLEYPTWESLPDSLKYSNVRQAMNMVDKLQKIDCIVAEDDDERKLIEELTEAEIEFLAEYEHELWVKERTENGWTYGPQKDVKNKTSPHLVPYNQLSEDVKELDRDTAKNLIPLLAEVGLKVYRE